jgi:hypothetical protein
VIDGALDSIIEALRIQEQAQLLQSSSSS